MSDKIISNEMDRVFYELGQRKEPLPMFVSPNPAELARVYNALCAQEKVTPFTGSSQNPAQNKPKL